MQEASSESTPLNPFPHGWYVLAESRDLAPNTHMARVWMGKEIIIWRARDGALLVADAFCPHLGAHLGPEAGGRLMDNRLVCPFHGFEYEHSGKCGKVTQGAAPSAIRLTTYPAEEVNGLICAYYDSSGEAPQWSIPDLAQSHLSHRAMVKRRIRAHPQITTENSVDWAHLTYLHGYHNLKQRQPTEIDGPFLNTYYAFDRAMTTPLVKRIRFRCEINVSVWGLGISTVRVYSPDNGLESRQWLLATPVDGEHIDYWMGSHVSTAPKAFGVHLLPEALVLPRLSKSINKELVAEVGFDERVWQRMQYRPNPALCQADGDIFRYRQYCQQFYPSAES